MKITDLTTRLKSRRIVSLSTLLPTAVVAASLLSALLVATLLFGEHANRAQRQQETARLNEALDGELADAALALANTLAAQASAEGRAATLLPGLRRSGRYGVVVHLPADGGPESLSLPDANLESVRDGGPAFPVAEGLIAWGRASARPTALGLLAGHIHVLLRADWPGSEGGRLLAALPLDSAALRRLERAADLYALTIRSTHDSADEGVSVPDAAGKPAGSLVWRMQRPGDAMVARVLPLATLGLFVLSALGIVASIRLKRTMSHVEASQREAEHLAAHDVLTGMPNRMLFIEHLEQELDRVRRGSEGIAVLFLDLDGFKIINDSFGHAVGDQLLLECGKRMRATIRGTDTLARLGGDEFAIIQTDVTVAHQAALLAQRLIDEVKRPFEIEGLHVRVGVSVGIALAPENGSATEDLMRLADIAMYRAKHAGRGRFAFFEQRMDESLRMRKVVEDNLRAAIDTDQLRLLYQPQVSPDGRRIVGVEALVRWHHPELGIIPPLQFITLAEERGLIVPLGAWVLKRACLDALAWGDLTVAVNVSAAQFKQKDFVTSVKRVLDETGIDPGRVELELTESVLIDDADNAEEAMINLRGMGLKLALDDFGTGYSSLIYLRRFAFDKIKIDKSFLEAMEMTGESAILVHSVVHLGRALGLTVTAEGVETAEQHRFLQAVGCHLLQGYLFSRPVPAEAITATMQGDGVHMLPATASAA
jgi:diguanylate cyclase (GGDEF)-like protein